MFLVLIKVEKLKKKFQMVAGMAQCPSLRVANTLTIYIDRWPKTFTHVLDKGWNWHYYIEQLKTSRNSGSFIFNSKIWIFKGGYLPIFIFGVRLQRHKDELNISKTKKFHRVLSILSWAFSLQVRTWQGRAWKLLRELVQRPRFLAPPQAREKEIL